MTATALATPDGFALATHSFGALALSRELDWLEQSLHWRLRAHLEPKPDQPQPPEPPLPLANAPHGELVNRHAWGPNERLVLILALAPHLRPQALDPLFALNPNLERGYTEFGGWQGKHHGGFLPTLETALFLLAGTDLSRREQAVHLFSADHDFQRHQLLRTQAPEPHEPGTAALLLPTAELLRRLLGPALVTHEPPPPAHRLETPLEWADLVLPDSVKQELDRVHAWLVHGHRILYDWGLAKILRRGYHVLFCGPPGTGKTLAATLLGKRTGAEVFRVDLSQLVSKYIGDTEKNLAALFDLAQTRNWILFFDEADSLFAKRTRDNSIHDRHANQETGFLLQRIEQHPGIVVLATNLIENIDEAFFRRFQSVVHFPLPDEQLRLRLWRQGLAPAPTLDLDLPSIARDYPLSGGTIANAIRQGALSALQAERTAITQADLLGSLERPTPAAAAPADRPALMIRGPLAKDAATLPSAPARS